MHATCSAGACDWQYPQRLRGVGCNHGEAFQSPHHCPHMALETRRRQPGSALVGCVELANGHCFVSIYYAADSGHNTSTAHREGETFVPSVLQMTAVSLAEVILLAQLSLTPTPFICPCAVRLQNSQSPYLSPICHHTNPSPPHQPREGTNKKPHREGTNVA